MKRECAWCGQNLGRSISLDEKGVTHGICLVCREKMIAAFRLACVRKNLFQDSKLPQTVLCAGAERMAAYA